MSTKGNLILHSISSNINCEVVGVCDGYTLTIQHGSILVTAARYSLDNGLTLNYIGDITQLQNVNQIKVYIPTNAMVIRQCKYNSVWQTGTIESIAGSEYEVFPNWVLDSDSTLYINMEHTG